MFASGENHHPSRVKRNDMHQRRSLKGEDGRAGEIRTRDLLNPIQAHYQAVLRPDVRGRTDSAGQTLLASVFCGKWTLKSDTPAVSLGSGLRVAIRSIRAACDNGFNGRYAVPKDDKNQLNSQKRTEVEMHVFQSAFPVGPRRGGKRDRGNRQQLGRKRDASHSAWLPKPDADLRIACGKRR